MDVKVRAVSDVWSGLLFRWRVVVVRTNKGRIGLIVDRTLGQTEIVIKTLGQYLTNTRFVSGGTILGDGTVALILDVVQVGS